MARPLDSISKDKRGFVRVGPDPKGVVLFRLINTAYGPTVHIRLKNNCFQVLQRGDPDYYVPWEDFKEVIEEIDES